MTRALRSLVLFLVLAAAAPAAANAAPPDGVTGMALDGRVELAWQPAAGATGYKVYRGTTATAVNTPLMASPLTPPDLNVPANFVDITAVNGTTYYYAVRAIIGGVESANSRIVQARPRARTCSGLNPVVQENCFPGDADWDSGLLEGIDGFATASSIDHGASVGLKLQSTASTTANIEIFRSGNYGGAGARLFSTILDVPVGTQPGCATTANVGLTDCSGWAINQMLTTTTNWPSGMYLIRVTRKDNNRDTHIPLVVRDDGRGAQVLYAIPDTTYQAYNSWGGKSLYTGKSSGANTVTGTPRAAKVSFDRPYIQPHDEINRDWYPRTDYQTVFWLERAGYDVSYTAASDLERRGASVRDHRIYISGAHDEYYSAAMRTALEQARDAGVDLFFTGANEVYWKVRFEPSPVTGAQDRVLVCYKTSESGPADPSGIPTGTWRDPAGANQPENALAGGQYVGQKNFSYFPLRVPSAQGKDRIWRYTGLDTQAANATASVGTAIVGWEWDSRVDNGREPAGVTTLATSPVDGDILQDAGATYAPGSANAIMTKHQRTSGALVVSTGTNHWSWGLARNALNEGEPDRRIRQATTNILFDMGAFPETPETDIVLDDPSSPPLLTLRVPAANAVNVDKTTVVRAGFSRPMDPATITTSSFSLRRPDGTTVPATVSYDDVAFTATLTPSSALDLETTYTVQITSAVKAANGIAFAGPASWTFTTRPPDRTPPTTAITAPASGATVVASTTVTASASDDTAVAGVQFKLDGNNLGAEDTAAPYSITWDATGVSAGSHTLTAVAKDTSGNTTTSAAVPVTVDPTGLVLALGFEESSGTTATDSSGKGNNGTVSGATQTAAGRFGRALSFDGVNDWVTVPDAATLDLTNAMTLEAWVSPAATGSWRTVLMKEQAGGLVYGLYGNNNTNTPSLHIHNGVEHDIRGTGALPTNTWTHLAATFDGTTARLYVNGTQVSTGTFAGSMITSTGALHIGGNAVWGEYLNGKIDELRVYRRVLSATDIQTDMNRSVVPLDSVPPTAPTGLTATGQVGRAQLSWTAATDNTGVTGYEVYRSQTSGFTPSAANRVAQPTGTSYTDTGLAPGTWYYRVAAADAAGNVGPASSEAQAVVTADTTPPTVSVTAPTAGATVQNTISLTASATDNVGVTSVQFKVDNTDAGAAVTSAPFTTTFGTRALANGTHTITAVAKDAAGNTTTSSGVQVTVDNPPVDTSGLVAAYGFEEKTGSTVADSSNQGNGGTITGATRTTAGRFGEALSFTGTNNVSVPDSSSLDLATAMTLEAWVNPATAANAWRAVLLKEQTTGLAYALYESTSSGPPSANIFTTREDDVRGTAALPANTWSHLAATYDGATLRLYVNGTQVASKALTGALVNSSGALRIGGSVVTNEFFNGLVDEVRVYNRALTAGEIQTDMGIAVVPAVVDGQAPTAPTGLSAAGAIGQIQLGWTAATDNLGVARYNVHRGTSAGFTPTTANRIAQPTGTSYPDTGLATGTYFYKVTAQDAAGNVSPASNEATATATADTTPPTVSVTSPTAGATLTNSATLTATAADNVGVASVQFTVDSVNVGSPDTSAPYSVTFDTRTLSNGTHTIRARATDAAGLATTSAGVDVTVDNPPIDTTGLVAAYGFEEASGTAVDDSSSAANSGTLNGATRSAGGRFGSAISVGANANVGVPASTSLALSSGMTLEAWVNPTTAANAWRPVIVKEHNLGLAYALYESTSNGPPSAHVFTTSEQDVRGTAALPANTWSHLAATWNGATLILYVNGTQVATKALTGTMVNSTGALRIGGSSTLGEWFTGLVDEVRVYNRPLTAVEVGQDMNRPVVAAVGDTVPPSAPSGLTATGSLGQAQLSWTAATDNTGVARYNVHRGTTAGFTATTANRIARPTSTSYVDNAPAGVYFYKVTAEDAAGNIGPVSNEATATITADTTLPTVSITAPLGGATVSGTTTVTASASDNVAVAGVQFKLDGANLGNEDTSAPYSFDWDTLAATEGAHTLTAVAKDGAGNTRTSADVNVTVSHPPVDNSGLVGAWGFEEGGGTLADDKSSSNNDGTVNGPLSTDSGRYGKALSFDGINDRVDVPDSASLDLTDQMTLEAWVKPAQNAGWRTVMLKENGSANLTYAMYGSSWNDNPSGHVNPGTEQWTRGVNPLPVATWSHLAVTYDGATVRLYVNGVQVSSAAVTGGLIQTSTGALRIGGNAIWGEYFKGEIDEVRVYRKPLTAAQITSDMAKPVQDGAPPSAGPEVMGEFAPPQTWPLVPVHMATLSNGKIAVWDGFDAALNSEREWDPNTGMFNSIPTGRNLFCAGHVTLPDGRLFVAGGHIEANVGTKSTSIYNPNTRQWFFGQDMQRARWYPTVTTLPDGRLLVVSGDNITLNAPNMPVPLKNGAETLPEIYDVNTNQWTPLQNGQRRMPLYPFMFVLPDGRVVDAGPDLTTRTLNTTTGVWTTVAQSPVDGHSAVMYRPGKILKSGTWADPDYVGIQSTNRAATIDFNVANPQWTEIAPMHHGRSYHTLTVLPDGKVFASGGMSETDGIDRSKAVFPTEIWDPDTGVWTEAAAHQRPREYHSSALLLQDGRVLLAGGGAFPPNAQDENSAEIYSPPYLFRGARPTITVAPTNVNLGTTFTVQTPDAASIDKVSLIRMGSVTHNFDMDQRFMYLNAHQDGANTLSVDAPTNRNVAIPGWYYLFINKANGVPSKGWIVKIDPPATDTQAPTAPSAATATSTDDHVDLSWNASTDNTAVTEYRVHRSTTAGFTPSAANRIATVSTGTTYRDNGLSPATYYYRVVAADAAGNASAASNEANATVTGDTTAPTVSVTAPAEAATVGGTVNVTANATDNRGVTSVQFKVDGANLGSADTSAPYTASWNTAPVSNGAHQITAVASDAAGNSATSAVIHVTVDNGSPPTVAVTAPAAGATVTGTINLTANATDDRGVSGVQFKVDGANAGAEDTSAPYSVSWDSRTVLNGARKITAVARDTDGNLVTSAEVNVNVSNATTGLVGAYGFEETTGTDTVDSSGGARTGTLNGPTRSLTGKFGSALSFDGINDWVTIPDANALDLTNAMTLEAWVRPSAISSWRTVLMKEQSGGLAYGLYANSNTNRPSAHITTSSEQDTRGTAQLALNAWTHLAVTYDGTTLRLFVNGVQASSKAIGGSIVTTTGVLRIGGNGVWPEWFAGLIDEVRLYNRVLTAAEVQADMNLAVVPPG